VPDSAVVYLTLEDLPAIIAAELGDHRAVVADFGLLDAAVHRPATVLYDHEVYPGMHAKAAALLHSLVTSHPLGDGDKRLGALAMLVFYALNGIWVTATDDELFDLVMAVAGGTEREVGKIAGWLADHTAPIGEGSLP
jgi:death-on-curing protein